MKFSDEFEQRFAEMVPHYPTKRSALVPTLLYAQDEVGFLSDEVIAEIWKRQKARGYQPPTREEVGASLQAERESWDD